MERISDTGLVVPKGVFVRSIKYGDHRFSDRKVIGLTTGIEFETGALKIDVAIAAEADCKYHDMLAEAVDGGSRKNRINGVYVVSLPNGGRGVSRAVRRSTHPLVSEGICNDRDIKNEQDRGALLIATAALSLVMLNPGGYVGREDAVVIGADAIQLVLDGRSPAKLFSAMPNVL